MALVAAAVCPHPPLLVPEVASGAAHELEDLRASCVAAVDALRGTQPDLLVVVGRGPRTEDVPAGTRGTFAGFGVPRDVVLGAGEGRREHLPLSLAVGAWLLETAAYDGPVAGVAVGATGSAEERASLGSDIAARADRVALLVMGDGSARRSPKAPGASDRRASHFDASVVAAFVHDVDAVLRLDTGLADQLMVAGWPAWQVLAGGARSADLVCDLKHAVDPYGVLYLVATWLPA